VAPGKVGRRGSHRRGESTTWGAEAAVRRRSKVTGQFWWPVMRAMRSCSTIGPRRMRGGRQRRAIMAGVGSLPNGAIGSGGGFTSGGVGMPLAVDCG
jgi:hypothetical protein